MPTDFPAFIREHAVREAMARYGTGYSVIARWVREAGLRDEVRERRNVAVVMPVDFAEHAHKPRREITAHYGHQYDNQTLARFRQECGVALARRVGNGAVMAQAPADFAARVATMSRIEAGRHYHVGSGIIDRWARETGATFRQWRRFAPAGPKALTPAPDSSRAGQAAQYLRRYFVPVYDRGKVEGRRFTGSWRVGSRTLATDELLALAETKGFVPWLEAA